MNDFFAIFTQKCNNSKNLHDLLSYGTVGYPKSYIPPDKPGECIICDIIHDILKPSTFLTQHNLELLITPDYLDPQIKQGNI